MMVKSTVRESISCCIYLKGKPHTHTHIYTHAGAITSILHHCISVYLTLFTVIYPVSFSYLRYKTHSKNDAELRFEHSLDHVINLPPSNEVLSKH